MIKRTLLGTCALVAACALAPNAAANTEVARCGGGTAPGVQVTNWWGLTNLDCEALFSVASARSVDIQISATSTFTGGVGFILCRTGGQFCQDTSEQGVRIVAGQTLDSPSSVTLPAGDWILWTHHDKVASGLPRVSRCIGERCADTGEQYVQAEYSSGSYTVVVVSAD